MAEIEHVGESPAATPTAENGADTAKMVTLTGIGNATEEIPVLPPKEFSLWQQEELTREREKRQKRAERFGTKFREPFVRSVLPEGLQRRPKVYMANNPNAAKVVSSNLFNDSGDGHSDKREHFVTGFNPMSAEELQRAEERRRRFGRSGGENAETSAESTESQMHEADDHSTEDRVFQFPLSELVTATPPQGHALELATAIADAQVQRRPEALHVYGVDRMSTKEILQVFSGCNPAWVEWINDSSCNITFNDAGDAMRALVTLSAIKTPSECEAAMIDAINGGAVYVASRTVRKSAIRLSMEDPTAEEKPKDDERQEEGESETTTVVVVDDTDAMNDGDPTASMENVNPEVPVVEGNIADDGTSAMATEEADNCEEKAEEPAEDAKRILHVHVLFMRLATIQDIKPYTLKSDQKTRWVNGKYSRKSITIQERLKREREQRHHSTADYYYTDNRRSRSGGKRRRNGDDMDEENDQYGEISSLRTGNNSSGSRGKRRRNARRGGGEREKERERGRGEREGEREGGGYEEGADKELMGSEVWRGRGTSKFQRAKLESDIPAASGEPASESPAEATANVSTTGDGEMAD